uniref:NADH-ubiquinone oxidoreductase chain 5 n=1 Tax=Coridius chinensis TaxID=1028097 RepID=K7P9W7_CORCQ|nr:NADH dehydrogenase subunit 5 [Coridius chinensis]
MYKYWSLNLFMFSAFTFFIGLYFIMTDFSFFLDWEVISINSVSLTMTCMFDWMSLIFMSCVLFISSMVILYSHSYMGDDIFKYRFLLLVLLFVLSMMFLIISPNLVSILLGWDGLGLVSYCLVIYFQNFKSFNAGMLTVLTNRIGDVAILISIAWFFNKGGFNYMFYMDNYDNWSFWVAIFIILAAFTKSAQIPFSSWLPAAMAAPTPVSALVHSSTLVTAGVYLLIRFNEFIMHFNMSLPLYLSCMTMFMAGLGANFEYDLKKIIALSTLSQLGFMMGILFMGYPILSYLHLLTHAFFKALLFLCAGLIIHCMNNSQDIRHMGYLVNQMPYTCACFCISTLSLCGFPFMSGFYSKDFILEYLTTGYLNLFIYVIYFISVGLTVSYSFRLIYYCFGSFNGLSSSSSVGEDSVTMFSMLILTLLAICSGSLLSWLLIFNLDLLLMPIECKLMPLLFVLLGSWLGWVCSVLSVYDTLMGLFYHMPIYFMGSMWFMPYFSTFMFYSNGLFLSKSFTSFMDYGWGEYLVSGSFSSFFNWLSQFNVIYQNNNVKIYLISFLIVGLFLIILS